MTTNDYDRRPAAILDDVGDDLDELAADIERGEPIAPDVLQGLARDVRGVALALDVAVEAARILDAGRAA